MAKYLNGMPANTKEEIEKAIDQVLLNCNIVVISSVSSNKNEVKNKCQQ